MINVEISQEAMSAAVGKAVEGALSDGLQSWAIKNDVRDIVQQGLLESNLLKLIGEEIKKVLKEKSVQIVEREIKAALPGIEHAIHQVINQALARMIWGLLQTPSSYSTEEMAKWKKAVDLVNGEEPNPTADDQSIDRR
jgi:hypothetical protein